MRNPGTGSHRYRPVLTTLSKPAGAARVSRGRRASKQRTQDQPISASASPSPAASAQTYSHGVTPSRSWGRTLEPPRARTRSTAWFAGAVRAAHASPPYAPSPQVTHKSGQLLHVAPLATEFHIGLAAENTETLKPPGGLRRATAQCFSIISATAGPMVSCVSIAAGTATAPASSACSGSTRPNNPPESPARAGANSSAGCAWM